MKAVDVSWEAHRTKVAALQGALTQQAKSQEFIVRSKSSGTHPHSMRHRQGAHKANLSLADFNGILGFDESGGAVWVEPGVSMDTLCRWTLARGFVPLVVPEFKGITVAGAIMGTALETSSFIHGQFNDICLEYELILADGTMIKASASEHSDLFYGVSGSYGTLATLTSVLIRLHPAPTYIEQSYHIVNGLENLPQTLEEACLEQETPLFVEGVVLDANTALVMTGRPAFEQDVQKRENIRRFDAFWRPWYIQHLIGKAKEANTEPEWIPIYDYLFRLDRSAFWMGQFCTSAGPMLRYLTGWEFQSPKLPSKLHASYQRKAPNLCPGPLFRFLTGGLFSSRRLYQALHELPESSFGKTYHVQDFYIPFKKLNDFVQHVATQVGVFPLWICPMRGTETPQLLSPHLLSQPSKYPQPDFVNVGVYGIPTRNDEIPKVTRELEHLAHQLGGRKMLYAYTYTPEDEFWTVYDKAAYQNLRSKYGSDGHFPDIFSKITSRAQRV